MSPCRRMGIAFHICWSFPPICSPVTNLTICLMLHYLSNIPQNCSCPLKCLKCELMSVSCRIQPCNFQTDKCLTDRGWQLAFLSKRKEHLRALLAMWVSASNREWSPQFNPLPCTVIVQWKWNQSYYVCSIQQKTQKEWCICLAN